jgi:hypothetical protein
MRAIAYVVGLGSAVFLAGCGIGSTDSLFVSGGVGGGAASSGGQGGTNPAGGGQGGAPTTSSTGGSSSSVAQSSASQSSSVVASSSTGAGPTIECGDKMCPLDGNGACCWDQFGFSGGNQASCVKGQPNQDGCNTMADRNGGYHVQITCRLPSDCPGNQFCCGHRAGDGQNQYYDVVSCQPQCNQPNIRICDPNDNSDTCGGQNCGASQTLPPDYNRCGG